MKRDVRKKLSLSRETLLNLSEATLEKIGGGGLTLPNSGSEVFLKTNVCMSQTCPNTYMTCPSGSG
jgi:hypothetical protein